MIRIKYCVFLLISLFAVESVYADNNEDKQQKEVSLKKERNFVRKGNKLYNDKRYAEAEVEYKKALQINPTSSVANYNLATSLIRQGGGAKANDKEDKNNPINQAQSILNNLVKTCSNQNLVAKAYYNLGNIDFNREQYQGAIENYKNSLRRNPNDDKARENLRLAQKKQQEQKQDDNKDKNQDKQQQQQQQQNQDQNKDQNKDKDQNQQNQSQQQKQNQNQNQQNQGGMSQDNIDQILKTMQNQENAIQQKINAQKAKEKQNSSRRTGNQW